jgi:hypothetical protein
MPFIYLFFIIITMKTKIILTLFLVGFFLFHLSCSKDDGTNEVTLKVYSNTAGVPINLSGGGIASNYLTIKDYFEKRWSTDWDQTYISARCDDKTVLITVEVYINGKLKEREVGNSWVEVYYNIK